MAKVSFDGCFAGVPEKLSDEQIHDMISSLASYDTQIQKRWKEMSDERLRRKIEEKSFGHSNT